MIKKGLSRLVIFFLFSLSLTPFWFLYFLSDLLYPVIYHIARYRVSVVRQNLLNSFPEMTEKERRTIEKRYYRYLADLIVETIKMITISADEVKKRMVPTNPEIVDIYFAQHKNMIGAVGHYGNWELAAHRFSLIMPYQKIIVYKPLNNQLANNYYKKVRERFGAILVPMKSTLRKLAELRKELTFTVLVSDQTPIQSETQYFTGFLNQPTAVFMGTEKIAKMLDAAVVFCEVKRLKRGYYTYTFIPLCESPKLTADYEITDLHVKSLEKMIKREPQYWLWSHRRWKFSPEDLH